MEKKPFTTEIKTARLILRQRKLTFEMAEDLSASIKRNQSFLRPWMTWAVKPKTPEECLQENSKSEPLWNEMTNAGYLIYDKKGVLMGASNMSFIDYDIGQGELGYWLGEEFTGNGYASETVRALENDFFNRGMERIEVRSDSLNIPSHKVAIRCGYSLEGILRHNDWNTTHTERRDTKIFSKLRHEWLKEQKER